MYYSIYKQWYSLYYVSPFGEGLRCMIWCLLPESIGIKSSRPFSLPIDGVEMMHMLSLLIPATDLLSSSFSSRSCVPRSRPFRVLHSSIRSLLSVTKTFLFTSIYDYELSKDLNSFKSKKAKDLLERCSVLLKETCLDTNHIE